MSEDASPLEHFNGVARLFPLPNLVFFPHVMQPLHIFEPRYRQMTADALGDDRLIALVMLRDGWDKDYDAKPAIHPVACLGQIIAEQRLEDGRYNLLLRGVCRVRILTEPPTPKLYRSANVEVLHDAEVAPTARRALRKQLIRGLPSWLPQKGELYEQLAKALRSKLRLGALADLLSFALPFGLEFKQRQLEEVNVEWRVARLLEQLPTAPLGGGDRKFPPDFSAN